MYSSLKDLEEENKNPNLIRVDPPTFGNEVL